MIININQNNCMICGKKMENKIKAHLIPKCITPTDNITIYLHRECEEKINKLYVSQEKKLKNKKIINLLENTIVGLTSKIEEFKEIK